MVNLPFTCVFSRSIANPKSFENRFLHIYMGELHIYMGEKRKNFTWVRNEKIHSVRASGTPGAGACGILSGLRSEAYGEVLSSKAKGPRDVAGGCCRQSRRAWLAACLPGSFRGLPRRRTTGFRGRFFGVARPWGPLVCRRAERLLLH